MNEENDIEARHVMIFCKTSGVCLLRCELEWEKEESTGISASYL
jgi:hypothetical protein